MSVHHLLLCIQIENNCSLVSALNKVSHHYHTASSLDPKSGFPKQCVFTQKSLYIQVKRACNFAAMSLNYTEESKLLELGDIKGNYLSVIFLVPVPVDCHICTLWRRYIRDHDGQNN